MRFTFFFFCFSQSSYKNSDDKGGGPCFRLPTGVRAILCHTSGGNSSPIGVHRAFSKLVDSVSPTEPDS